MKFFRYFILLLTILILGACGKKEEPAQKTLPTLNVMLEWYPNAFHSFVYVGMEKGFYKDAGLNINILLPSNTTDPLALTAAGKADVGFYYMHDVILKRTKENIPVKSIGAVLQKSTNVIISPKDKNITGPQDLAHKKIGYSGDEYTEQVVKSLAKKNNIDPNSIEMVDVGFDLLTSMITNRVDGTIGCVVNHEVPVMEEKNIPINYFAPTDFGLPEYYGTVFVSSDETIKTKGPLLKKFLEASKRAFEYTKAHPEEAVDIILKNQQEESFPLNKNVETKSLEMLIPLMETPKAPFLSENKEVWEKNIQWLYEENMIPKKLPPEDFFVNLEN